MAKFAESTFECLCRLYRLRQMFITGPYQGRISRVFQTNKAHTTFISDVGDALTNKEHDRLPRVAYFRMELRSN